MKDATTWAHQLRDRRSRRVIFLAHCLLNENVRYLGGACHGGAIQEILDQCLVLDIGVVQLPCPEQQAWGGVLKRRLLSFYGSFSVSELHSAGSAASKGMRPARKT